jgi:hypothetical protein
LMWVSWCAPPPNTKNDDGSNYDGRTKKGTHTKKSTPMRVQFTTLAPRDPHTHENHPNRQARRRIP